MATTSALSVVHRSIDGYRYRISGKFDLGEPFTSVGRYAVDGRLYELTSGEHSVATGWTRDLGVQRFDDEFSLPNGRLRTVRVTDYDKRSGLEDQLLAVVWQGTRFSLFVPMYNAKPADAVHLFQLLGVTEHADGLTVATRNPKRAGIAEPGEMVKEVPGLGLLQVTALNKTTARRLPSWRGARLPHGELFRDTLDDDSTYFLLATPSAMVTVLPHEGETAKVPGRMAALKVETVA
ncbi:hypothetical protein [Actinoallomurus iriomotensis]|uniref:Uncharacterized protein n=1 Tax=Actinoallomurus iriomotensis TaxID=478107 RepID=A0A9W6SBL1_9ACTN|nr:hypothetical protein [Actinoallomurus iriomotensis]GLY90631.1 hypothetical protein Airi02_085600 [Actinoallomurus iriomotensis]